MTFLLPSLSLCSMWPSFTATPSLDWVAVVLGNDATGKITLAGNLSAHKFPSSQLLPLAYHHSLKCDRSRICYLRVTRNFRLSTDQCGTRNNMQWLERHRRDRAHLSRDKAIQDSSEHFASVAKPLTNLVFWQSYKFHVLSARRFMVISSRGDTMSYNRRAASAYWDR